MKYALLFALVALGSLRASDMDELNRLLVAGQTAVDSAFSSADHIVVEAVESRTERRLIWESSRKEEIQTLVGIFKILPPKIVKRIVNGQERISVAQTRCGCYGQLWVTVKKDGGEQHSFLVKHGRQVWCESMPVSGFDVDPAALDQFYARMMTLAKKKG